jgi:hypothetical protein
MKPFVRSLHLFFALILLFGGYNACRAQSESLYAGYKDIAWGSSLANVSAEFTGLEDLGMSEDNILHIYMQKNPIDGVDNRLFYFWNDKLVRVRLFYNHEFVTGIGIENFVNKMINSFGKPQNQRLRRGVHLNENETWDILETSWGDNNTAISFESREELSPVTSHIYQLQFQSVKLFKEILEGKPTSEPDRDWGW